jgi:hypothetical protein
LQTPLLTLLKELAARPAIKGFELRGAERPSSHGEQRLS